jgi:hypothetical protein
MWHDNVDAQYDCLSYVWGSDQDDQTISLNGRDYRLRRNLWDFLSVARTNGLNSKRTFWIDALCINQNSIAERNHQVAQMGSIYSGAQEVVSWLGFSQAIGRVLAFCVQLREANPQTAAETWELWDHVAQSSRLRADWKEFATHAYWKRAWITQEILLARRHKILVNEFELELASIPAIGMLLPGINRRGWAEKPDGVSWDSDMRVFNTYLEALCGKRKFVKKRLIDLFHELPKRESQLPRDRIYSLLSLTTDARLISVDYAKPDVDVLIQTLYTSRRSLCLCLWSYLANTLTFQSNSDSNNSFGGEVHHFRIPMHSVEVDLRKHKNLFLEGGGHHKHCSVCGTRLADKSYSDQAQLLCVRQLCDRAEIAHFWVNVGSKTIKRDIVDISESSMGFATHKLDSSTAHLARNLKVHRITTVEKPPKPFDHSGISFSQPDDTRKVTNISLTASVLIKLLQYDIKGQYATKTTLELCSKALERNGPINGRVAKRLHRSSRKT